MSGAEWICISNKKQKKRTAVAKKRKTSKQKLHNPLIFIGQKSKHETEQKHNEKM